MVHIQIDVLGEVVEAVEGRVEVYVDGGVRQGTDVLKALALGAKAVFIGRPVLWGLAFQVSVILSQHTQFVIVLMGFIGANRCGGGTENHKRRI